MPIELDDIRSGYNLSKINSNFQKIEDAWDEKLDRLVNDQGNQMEQQLDMNSNKIINHPPTDLEEPTDLVRVDALSEYGDFTGAIPVVASYVGNGVQTAFPKPVNANDARTFQVYIGGLRQEPYTDYFITESSVVFQQAPVLDVSVDIYGYNPVLLENSAPVYADPILANFVGDGTTTTFFVSAAGSSTDAAFISIDGVNQTPFKDFTNAGGSIQFTEAPPLNSEIFVRIFAPFTNNATDSLVIADGSTEPRTLGSRFAETINIKDFGAVGDGVTNDRDAIQAAIDTMTSGTTLFIPDGTYIVQAPDEDSYVFTVPNLPNLTIKGESRLGSELKIANNAGNYRGVIGPIIGSGILNGFTVRNLRINHNAGNNVLPDISDYSTRVRSSVSGYLGGLANDDVLIQDCDFVQCDSIVSLYFPQGTTIAGNITIKGNRWLDSRNGNGEDFDQSFINFTSESGNIIDNEFYCDTLLYQPRTAMEPHCSSLVCTNNKVYNFQVGINVTGISQSGRTRRHLVANNILDVTRDGILVWSQELAPASDTVGFVDCHIDNNIVKVSQYNYPHENPAFTATGLRGIYVFGGTLHVEFRGLKITNNTIRYDIDRDGNSSFDRGNQANSVGAIGWNLQGRTEVTKDLTIRGNSVYDCPASAIYMDGTQHYTTVIEDNSFVNCASNYALTPSFANKVPVYIRGELIDDVSIRRNDIVETRAVSDWTHLISIQDSLNAYTFKVEENNFNFRNSTDVSAVVGYISLPSSSTTRVLFTGVIPYDVAVIPLPNVIQVGEVSVKDTDISYKKITKSALDWIRIDYGSTVPTDNPRIGSIRYNDTPTVGNETFAWVHIGSSVWRRVPAIV